MNMIWHDHVASDGPAVSFSRDRPFIDQDPGDLGLSKDRTTVFRARRDKVQGRINPDPAEAAQVSVGAHALIVAGAGDSGQARSCL